TQSTLKAVPSAGSQAISAAARGRRLKVEFEAPAEDIVLDADAPQIEDAILNLIINAIEAIEDGGHITVSISQQETEETGAEAVIEVADTGHGISEKDLG